MQRFIFILLTLGAVAGATTIPVRAAGIVGSVVDARSGKALGGVPVTIARWEAHPRTWRATTRADGTFANITLPPGQYLVVARLPGRTLGCAVDDAFSGEVIHMRIALGGRRIMCTGPRVHAAMIDPNATADVYRIR